MYFPVVKEKLPALDANSLPVTITTVTDHVRVGAHIHVNTYRPTGENVETRLQADN